MQTLHKLNIQWLKSEIHNIWCDWTDQFGRTDVLLSNAEITYVGTTSLPHEKHSLNMYIGPATVRKNRISRSTGMPKKALTPAFLTPWSQHVGPKVESENPERLLISFLTRDSTYHSNWEICLVCKWKIIVLFYFLLPSIFLREGAQKNIFFIIPFIHYTLTIASTWPLYF